MIDLNNLPNDLKSILEHRFKDSIQDIKIPPTAFTTMQGELLEYDLDAGYLKTAFPVLDDYLNQFGNMQGGMVAAAVDNTFGPLSMLIAPPNFTRTLEIKYKKPVKPDMGMFFVEARLIEIRNRQVFLRATVTDKDADALATATAVHWIIQQDVAI